MPQEQPAESPFPSGGEAPAAEPAATEAPKAEETAPQQPPISDSDAAIVEAIHTETAPPATPEPPAATPTPAEEAAPAEPADTPEPLPAVEPEEPETPSFDILDTELGEIDDIEELKVDSFYKDITAEHIRELPVHAKQIVHNIRKAHHIELAKMADVVEKVRQDCDKLEEDLARRETEFSTRQAEFAALIEDPKVQEKLAPKDGELPDAFTEEGIQERINRGIADGLRNVFEPFQQQSATLRRQASLREFIETNPEMSDPAFRKQVADLVIERKNTGNPISTQDAFQLTKLQALERQQQERAAQERQARAQSARHVARTTSTGAPGSTDIPPDVKKDPYKLYQWLKDHPEEMRRIEASR